MCSNNYEEAKTLLQRAESVAEKELEEGDHRWKVKVKTEQALLHDKIGSVEEMEAAMKEGLEMWYRINKERSLQGLGNKHFIREVLNRYPERFPEEKYPR